MALEKWEIELRKQLEGVKPKVPEGDWEDRLKKEISDIPGKKKTYTSPFFFLVIILFCVFIFVLNWKMGFLTQCFKQPPQEKQRIEEKLPEFPIPKEKDDGTVQEIRALRLDLERLRNENKEKFDELQKKIKWNGERITLLGMLHNENWLVIKNEGANSSNYLYFNGDWTLSGHPRYLELTQEDKVFLERYVQKK